MLTMEYFWRAETEKFCAFKSISSIFYILVFCFEGSQPFAPVIIGRIKQFYFLHLGPSKQPKGKEPLLLDPEP